MAKATQERAGKDKTQAEQVLTPAQAAKGSLDGVAARDPDRIVQFAHPDAVDDFVAIGEFRGREAIRHFFEELFAAFPDFEFQVDRLVADRETAVAQWRARGTFSGRPFLGIEPTGRSVEIRGVDVMQIEDGLIRHNTIYYDGAAFGRAVGMLPRQGSLGDRAMLRAFNAVTRLRTSLRRRPN